MQFLMNDSVEKLKRYGDAGRRYGVQEESLKK